MSCWLCWAAPSPQVAPEVVLNPTSMSLGIMGNILLEKMGRLGSGLAFPLEACQVGFTMALPRHPEQVLSRARSCFIFLFKTETRYTNKNARQMLPS